MSNTTAKDIRSAAAAGFDVETTIEVSRHGRTPRIIFAALYAGVGLLIWPWMECVGFLGAILVMEFVISPPCETALARLAPRRAAQAYAVLNLVASCLYGLMALAAMANGSPIGVVMATTWITGSVLNVFVYHSANRPLFITTLAPIVFAAVVGPVLAFGFSWEILIIPALLALASLASRQYSLDHGALLTQLADRQVALADIERKLSIAIEASGDGMFEMDISAGELLPNAGWLAMLGYGPSAVTLPIRNWRSFVHPDDLASFERDFAAHFRGETPHTNAELRMRCEDGRFKWVLARARLVSRTASGEPWMLIGTTVDVSARKAMEHQLETARDLAEAANHAKSLFVANMSHEIRTPLNGVIGVTGALARTELSASQRDMVGLVQSSAQVLERMLSDILDQAKIEAGDFELQIAPFDLQQELEAAAELMRARADEKGLRFDVQYAQNAQGAFLGDAIRLRQILSNLASNAVKFTQAGAVSVIVGVREADAEDQPGLLRIDVSDSGIGFDNEMAAKLFHRFVQADESICREYGGTGLGLSICKSLVDLMGGRIAARSQLGVGSVFTIEIPLKRSMPLSTYLEMRAQQIDQAVGDQPSMRRLRILLAEDHPTNQRVVQLILEPHDIDLTMVSNGLEAVEVFQPGLFDLILMDMQMPVMDGLGATREIRRLERQFGGSPVPIAMFSANAMKEHLILAYEAGADHHIAKPITPERLLSGIDNALHADAAGSLARLVADAQGVAAIG